MRPSKPRTPRTKLAAEAAPHPVSSAELLLSMVEARCAAANGNGHGIDSRARQELEKIEEQIVKLEAAAADDAARQEIQQLHRRIDALRSQVEAHSTAWVKTELAR